MRYRQWPLALRGLEVNSEAANGKGGGERSQGQTKSGHKAQTMRAEEVVRRRQERAHRNKNSRV